MGHAMSFFFVLLAVCFEIYLAHEPYRANHIRATSFDTVISGYALQNHVIKTVREHRPLDCGLACLQTERCQSYNARQETTGVYECELSNSSKTEHFNDYKAVSGVTYYGSDTFPGLGCSVADCSDCVETKSHPFHQCPNDQSKSDYDLHFPGQDTDYYVSYFGLPSLSKFTISWWLKTMWVYSAGENQHLMPILSTYHKTAMDVISIAIKHTLEFRFQIVLPAGRQVRYHKLPPINDDRWHHMTVTWDNADGKHDFFLDGVHRSSVDNFQTGQVVPGDCAMVIGQQQDSFGGGFSSRKSLEGSISRLNIWDNVLSLETIVALARFPNHSYSGNLVSWSDLRNRLTGKLEANETSTVVSNVGKSNVALTFSQMSRHNYAVLPPYTGPDITHLTVCTWIDFSYSGKWPCLISYATSSNNNAFFIELYQAYLYISFANGQHKLGNDSVLHDKKWRHFCLTLDGVNGEANVYVEGNNFGSTTSLQKGHSLSSPGIWAFANEQDSYGGGFDDRQSLMKAVAQTNVWNYILPIEAIVGMSFGGTSVEGNLLRWSDLVTNFNPAGFFTSSTFDLYLPDAVVQKKRDIYCNENCSACTQSPSLFYARVGPRHPDNTTPSGIEWRCYCSENVGQDKNVKVISQDYRTRQQLLDIV